MQIVLYFSAIFAFLASSWLETPKRVLIQANISSFPFIFLSQRIINRNMMVRNGGIPLHEMCKQYLANSHCWVPLLKLEYFDCFPAHSYSDAILVLLQRFLVFDFLITFETVPSNAWIKEVIFLKSFTWANEKRSPFCSHIIYNLFSQYFQSGVLRNWNDYKNI